MNRAVVAFALILLACAKDPIDTAGGNQAPCSELRGTCSGACPATGRLLLSANGELYELGEGHDCARSILQPPSPEKVYEVAKTPLEPAGYAVLRAIYNPNDSLYSVRVERFNDNHVLTGGFADPDNTRLTRSAPVIVGFATIPPRDGALDSYLVTFSDGLVDRFELWSQFPPNSPTTTYVGGISTSTTSDRIEGVAVDAQHFAFVRLNGTPVDNRVYELTLPPATPGATTFVEPLSIDVGGVEYVSNRYVVAATKADRVKLVSFTAAACTTAAVCTPVACLDIAATDASERVLSMCVASGCAVYALTSARRIVRFDLCAGSVTVTKLDVTGSCAAINFGNGRGDIEWLPPAAP